MTAAESHEPWTQTPPRLDVAVVGTGRVGSVLGAALRRCGHVITACTAVSDISRLRADSLLPQVPVASVAEAVRNCDLVLLAVPDDVLPELVAGLAATHAVASGTFVVHTSGRYGQEVLEPLTAQGCEPMAIHPVMTFTGTSVDLARLSGCPFGVTAPSHLRAVAEALVVELGGEPVWIAQEQRPLYHAALAFGSNFTTTLVNECMSLLELTGVSEPSRLVAHLLGASLDNALRSGDQALTGPISRGDRGSVAAHMRVLSESSPRTLPAYRELARLTVARAVEAGTLQPQAAAQMLQVLDD